MTSFVINGEHFSFSDNRNAKDNKEIVRKMCHYLKNHLKEPTRLETSWLRGKCEVCGACRYDSSVNDDVVLITYFFTEFHSGGGMYPVLDPDWIKVMGEDKDCLDNFIGIFRCDSCKTWSVDFDY